MMILLFAGMRGVMHVACVVRYEETYRRLVSTVRDKVIRSRKPGFGAADGAEGGGGGEGGGAAVPSEGRFSYRADTKALCRVLTGGPYRQLTKQDKADGVRVHEVHGQLVCAQGPLGMRVSDLYRHSAMAVPYLQATLNHVRVCVCVRAPSLCVGASVCSCVGVVFCLSVHKLLRLCVRACVGRCC
jgi:hypothetical protein